LAVDVIVQSAGTRALSQALEETAIDVGELGTEEVAEGLTRAVVSEGLAIRSDVLAEAGAELAAEGVLEVMEGTAIEDTGRDIAVEGVTEVAQGAAELGAAAGLDAAAEELLEDE
jgi:hypothetical protein